MKLLQDLKNTEMVNPNLDEDRAIANMRRIKERVELRLQLDQRVKAALEKFEIDGDKRPLLALQQELIDDDYDLTINDDELVISTSKGEKIGAVRRR